PCRSSRSSAKARSPCGSPFSESVGRTCMRDDIEVNPKIKLAVLWTSVMFCYIYADYFGLFAPGVLWKMNQGQIPPLGRATDTVLIGVSLMMAIPALMIFL